MDFGIMEDLIKLFKNCPKLKEITYTSASYAWYTYDNTAITEDLVEHCPQLESIHIKQYLCYLTESDIIRIVRNFRLKSWSNNFWIGQTAGMNNSIDVDYSTNSKIKNIQIREILAYSSSTLEELTLSNVSFLHGQDLVAILSQCPSLRKLSITDGFEYLQQTKTGVSLEELVGDSAPAWVCSNLEYLHILIVDAVRTTKYKDLDPFKVGGNGEEEEGEEEEERRQKQYDIMMAQNLQRLFHKLQAFKNLRNIQLHWRFPLMETTRDYLRMWRKYSMAYDLPLTDGMKHILKQTLCKENMLWMNLRWEVGAPWHRIREDVQPYEGLKADEIGFSEFESMDYERWYDYDWDDPYNSRDFIEEAYDLHNTVISSQNGLLGMVRGVCIQN
ncbi:hypothetical protein BGX26_002801 [Mortierella sp. AD094]|nr:hypothetical protein BGX26_002801 [Mortierella sp. AD094]